MFRRRSPIRRSGLDPESSDVVLGVRCIRPRRDRLGETSSGDRHSALSGSQRKVLTVEERVEVVAACRYVDEAIPNAPWRMDSDWIDQHHIDLVVHGDDFSEQELDFFYKVPIKMGIFRTIPYTRGITTTEIILRCKAAGVGSE